MQLLCPATRYLSSPHSLPAPPSPSIALCSRVFNVFIRSLHVSSITSSLWRAQNTKKRERERERKSFSWVEGARVPYVTPGLISPLIYAAAKRANRRPWNPIKADRFSACVPIPLTYLGCSFPFCLPADVNVIGATAAAQLNRFIGIRRNRFQSWIFFFFFPTITCFRCNTTTSANIESFAI